MSTFADAVQAELDARQREGRPKNYIDFLFGPSDNDTDSPPRPALTNGRGRKRARVCEHAEAPSLSTECAHSGLGTSLESLSSQDLVQCNEWCLQNASKSKDPLPLLRDRLLLNLSVALALEGRSIRTAELIDFHHISVPNASPQTAYAVCMIRHVGKTQMGPKQLLATMRAKDVRLCTHNSLAMYLYYRWHVICEPHPDLSRPEACYDIKLFVPKSDSTRACTQAMSYTDHRDGVLNILNANHLSSKAETHATRQSAAQRAGLDFTFRKQIGQPGRWNLGYMEARYLTHLPDNFLRKAAGFNQADELYFLDRALVDPPKELTDQIFSWIDGYYDSNAPPEEADGGFLALLAYLRVVLVQDMAVMWKQEPNFILFQHAPFNTDAFRSYADRVAASRAAAENSEQTRLRQLVPDIAAQLRSLENRMRMGQEQQSEQMKCLQMGQEQIKEMLASLKQELEQIKGMVATSISTNNYIHAQLAQWQNAHANTVQPGYGPWSAQHPAQVMTGAGYASRFAQGVAPGVVPLSTPHFAPAPGVAPGVAPSAASRPAPSVSSRAASEDGPMPVPPSDIAHVAAFVAGILGEEPAFTLSRDISTVAELWEEWHSGIDGRPSVLEMDSQHGASWRSSVCERKFYSNRKVIIAEIQRLTEEQDISTEDAIALLEKRRGGRSIHSLIMSIKADKAGKRNIKQEEEDSQEITGGHEHDQKRQCRR